ncbi:MAG: choice-of-anchor D domain-containing protein, partial [Candidatus Cloacimonetes bacterium]|nr:choice-of-anchor D domain-containing protein [Candidatus Cloacimonadota bacterium]
MKKTLLLTVFLVLLMGMMSSLFAQNIVTIGDGTTTNTTTGAPAPYGTWYKAFRQQLLYKASDFTAAGATPGLISALSFNVQALDTCSPMLNYTIRLKATTQEALTTTFELGDYTTVWHSDEFMPTLDWNLHTLTTPFLWDGTSNLLVDISTDVMGAISHNALVYYTATAYNSSLRFQSDSANGSTGITGTTAMNRSNIRFLMSPPSPDPLFMVSPTAKNFGDVVLGFTPNQNFTIFNSGGGTLTINSISISGSNFFSLTNLPTLPAQLVMGSPATFKVVYAPTAAGDHTATVTITDNLRQTHTIALSGHGVDTTIYDLSYAQAFDEVAIPALPLGWSSIYQANVTTGYVRTVTTTPQSAPNCVTIYNSNDAAAIAMLIAPPLSTALAANTLRVKFYGKGSTSYAIKIGVMTNPTDPATFVEIQTITLTSAWAQYSVPLTTYTGTGKFIAFKHANNSTSQTIYVDDVSLELIAANDLAAVNVVGNSTPSMNNPTVYTVNVFNNGTASQSTYSVKLYNAAGTELATAAGTTVAAGATVGIPLTWTPTAEGAAVIYGKVILAGDINAANNQTPNLNITVLPAGILSVTIGDGTALQRFPLGSFYGYERSAALYTAAEIGAQNTRISTVSWYSSIATTAEVPTKVYMKSVSAATLTTDNWANMIIGATLLYDSTLSGTMAGDWNVFPLTSNFDVDQGSNLMILVERNFGGSGSSTAGGSTAGGGIYSTPVPGTHLTWNADSNPPTTTGTVAANRPNISITYTTYTVDTPPNPAIIGSPANGATNVMTSATLNWGSGGGAPAGYKLYFGTTNPPPFIQNITMAPYTPTLSLNTQYFWKIIPFNASGDAANCPVWSFTTGGPVVVMTNGQQAIPDGMTYSFYDSGGADGQYQNSENYTFTFTATNPVSIIHAMFTAFDTESGYDFLKIYNGANTSAPQIGPTTGYNGLTLPAEIIGSNAMTFVFTSDSSGLRDGWMAAVSAVNLAHDLGVQSISGNYTPSVGAPTTYSVAIKNNGANSESNYTVKLMNSANQELVSIPGTIIAPQEIINFNIIWTPTVEGPAVIYAKVVLPDDGIPTNNQTPNLNITVMPAGVISVTIGDGSTNALMPLDMFYKSSMYQTLYYPDEIGMIGNILSVSIYNNFLTTSLVDKPTKIWMGTTTQTDLSAGWIPGSEMTLVFDGTMTYPGGENTIIFPLSTIFPYSGGNLVVMWNRPLDTAYFSSSDYFKCQIVGTNRAREIHDDTTEYDPNNMTGGTLTGTFPKTSLIMTPMTGDPLFMVNPATKDFGTVLINTTNHQSFSVVNAGGGSLTINSVTISGSPMYSLQNVPTLPVSLNTGQTMVFTGRYSPTAEGTTTATITITDNLARSYEIKVNPAASRENRGSESRVAHTVALSGNCIDTTINALPYAQAFDAVTAPALPPDWSSIYQSTETTGYVKTVTTTPQSAPNCVAMYSYSETAAIAMLIAPPFSAAIATNSTRVKFYAKGSATYTIIVGVMSSPTDATTFVPVQTVTLTSAWAQYSVPLTTYAGTGKHVAFKHGCTSTYQTIYIDDVNLEIIAPNDLAAISVVGNSTPSMDSATVYTVNVFNNGTSSQNAYSVKLYNAAGIELATAAGTTIAAGTTVGIPLTWTPTAEGPVVLYGKVILAGDINAANDQTPNLNITVMPAGILSVTIGDGSTTARMPIDMYYNNSIYQTLYYPDEMGMIGNILSLSLYNNFFTTTLVDKPTKIWMGTTALADLSGGWIPSSQMTLVFDGTMTYPGGENTITFPLSTMFPYTGGNLVVMWNRPMDTAWYSSMDYFKCQVVGTNRARNAYSNSTPYDPNAMSEGTLTGTFPKTTLVMTPMTGEPVFGVTP